MKWGESQEDCHKLLREVFDARALAYAWLYRNFKVRHFSELNPKKDKNLLNEIHGKLLQKSISRIKEYE